MRALDDRARRVTAMRVLALGLCAAGIGALAWALPPERRLLPLCGSVAMAAGVALGRLRWQSAIGIRTPWTLASAGVWQRTHRVGGRLLVGCGILLAIAEAARGPQRNAGEMLAFAVLGSVVAILAKSYVYWLRERHPDG